VVTGPASLSRIVAQVAVSIRRFFLVSLVLAGFAIGLELSAQAQFARGAGIVARSVVLPESQRLAARSQAKIYRARGTVVAIVGFGFALAASGFVVASAQKHEPAWRSVTVALLVFYVMLQFTLT
jgi:hypothetical protein